MVRILSFVCSITTGTDPNRIVFWSGSNFDPEVAATGTNCRGKVGEAAHAPGGFPKAQLTSDYVEADGIHLPTRRRAYARGRDNRPILDLLLVSIDIDSVRLA